MGKKNYDNKENRGKKEQLKGGFNDNSNKNKAKKKRPAAAEFNKPVGKSKQGNRPQNAKSKGGNPERRDYRDKFEEYITVEEPNMPRHRYAMPISVPKKHR
ncbi:MAG: hypothetical protein GX891_02995 [Clostridiales bacterium]|nr:hypothetical protein [Clostridiales bacterium]